MDLADVSRIGVVGAGTMGHGIAINFALAGYPTLISDQNDGILAESKARIQAALDLFVEEGLISRRRADEAVSLITGTTLEDIAGQCDFITEAIVDRSSDKRALFNRLDELCPPQTIFASNTSSLVLSDFGSDVKRQDKIVLTHYFAPPHIVPGVEVAKGPGTSDETYELTCDLMAAARKVPIRLKMERPGYLLNTVQRALGQAATDLWAEGMASAEDIELGIIHIRVSHAARGTDETLRPCRPLAMAGGRAGFLGECERADEAAPGERQAVVHRPRAFRRSAGRARS